MGVSSWLTTAADNDDADLADGVDWREGQAPSTVNNSGRAMMKGIAELLKDLGGTIVSTGSTNEYTITTNVGYTALAENMVIVFEADKTSSGAATATVDGLTQKSIFRWNGAATQAGDIVDGGVYFLIYNSGLDGFVGLNIIPALGTATALSLFGRSANSSGAYADIAAGSDHQVMRRSGTSIGFGAVNLAQSAAVTGVLPATNLPDSSTTAEGVAEIATAAEYRTKTDTARHLGVAEVWTAALAATLTDDTTIAVDFAAGFNFGGSTTAKLSLGGDRTLGAPSNVVGGQSGVLWFGAASSTRILTLNAAWNLCTGVETGPYSITTSQTLGIAYVTLGSTVYVTAILRAG